MCVSLLNVYVMANRVCGQSTHHLCWAGTCVLPLACHLLSIPCQLSCGVVSCHVVWCRLLLCAVLSSLVISRALMSLHLQDVLFQNLVFRKRKRHATFLWHHPVTMTRNHRLCLGIKISV